jgi:formylglycine-generating enzyme required for sulfatase activity
MDFLYIKPGKFTMGGESTAENNSDCPEVPKHEVIITKGFYLGKYEVTRAQFAAIGAGDGKAIKDADHPQGSIRLESIVNFCKKLNEKTGRQVRLPTEAEWEYAAQSGSSAMIPRRLVTTHGSQKIQA